MGNVRARPRRRRPPARPHRPTGATHPRLRWLRPRGDRFAPKGAVRIALLAEQQPTSAVGETAEKDEHSVVGASRSASV